MRRIAQGDSLAFRQLAERHLPSIHAYALRLLGRREEAEEVAQETFLRCWQSAKDYDGRSRPTTWLHAIAHHAAVDRLRRRREASATDYVEAVPQSERTVALIEEQERARALQQALDALPERQREAIVLTFYQGLGNREVAQTMGLGVQAVESLLSRGRRKLKELLLEGWGPTDQAVASGESS